MDWEQLLSIQRQPGKSTLKMEPGNRSPFDQDYDRIVFSHPFRRLQDKTQVFPLPEYDFVHTRLTHSIEVSSVGRSLGRRVGQVILDRNTRLTELGYSPHDFGAIVAASSLAHDVGNPPFGHSGETAISDFFTRNKVGKEFKKKVNPAEWEDLTNFEGNAQGFRILSGWADQGLKLTYASMAAFVKYPRSSSLKNIDKSRRSQKKYGFFQNERERFNDIADSLGLIKLSNADDVWCRHPLTFLVEAADDICYQIIDLEDGSRLGLVSFNETVDLLREIIGGDFDKNKFNALPDANEKVGTLRAMAIGRLVNESIQLFLDNEEDILSGKFDTALTDKIPSSKILSQISKLSVDKIYQSRAVMEREVAGFEVIEGLLEAFSGAALGRIENGHSLSGKEKAILRIMPREILDVLDRTNSTPYSIALASNDHISGLTDSHAIATYRKLKGMTLSRY